MTTTWLHCDEHDWDFDFNDECPVCLGIDLEYKRISNAIINSETLAYLGARDITLSIIRKKLDG